MMPLTDVESVNFETVLKAAENGDLALARSRLSVDIPAGTEVAVLVAVMFDGETYDLAPFAMLLPGNPYEMLVSPAEGLP